MKLWLLATALGWAIFAQMSIANARVTASLDYIAASGVDGCPSHERMREMVAAELGYDPFGDGSSAQSVVTIRIDTEPQAVVAEISQTSVSDSAEKPRRLKAATCTELAATVAFTVAMALDPDVFRSVRGPGPLSQSSVRTPEPKLDKPKAVTSNASKPQKKLEQTEPAAPDLGWSLAAGSLAGAGLVPGVSFAPYASVAMEGEFWSLAMEVQAFVPGSETLEFAEVSASIVRGAAVPCLTAAVASWLSLAGCGHVSLGAILSEARQVTRSIPSTSPHLAVGPRAQLWIRPWPVLGFVVGGELDVIATRVHLEVDDQGTQKQAWVTPTVAGLAQVAVSAHFR